MEKSNDRISLTKLQVALIVAAFVGTVLGVGLMAGLLRPPCPGHDHPVSDQGIPPSGSDPDAPWTRVRLTPHVIPLHYDLSLYPDFYADHGEFYGNVSIIVRVQQSTRHLLVHIKNLVITSCELEYNSTGDVIPIHRNFSHPENEFWVTEVRDEDELTSGSVVVLSISFHGPLTGRIVGFYKTAYVDSRTNQTRYLATSKFQPTHARKAFPCFDEPAFKSTFTVTLIHKPEYVALSNMPPVSTSQWAASLVATTFQKSVPMVTYLVCFVVSDFLFKEGTTKSGIPFRVYAAPDRINQVDYALGAGMAILDHFERYFNSAYPLPKQDMIGIPDFVSGATEHWGLISYREANLLVDPTVTSAANRQAVANVVSHELAHMWFGNLVTMDWWDDLWLNEGFASFIEYKGVDYIHPEWDMSDQFVTADLQRAMRLDGRTVSHPIVVSVTHPDEISQVFDSISYSKGASVIRMLEAFMGEDNFRRGIQDYITTYEYKTAVTGDLWTALEKVPGAPKVKELMDTWTLQMGFPVLNVIMSGSKVKVLQERFLFDADADKTEPQSPFGYKWNIPLTFMTNTGETGQKLMLIDDEVFDTGIVMEDSVKWVKFNVNQTGYYKVNYPDGMWSTFAEQLQTDHQVLSPADRASLLSDIFDLAKTGEVSYDQALSLASYMKKEEHTVPWRSMMDNIRYISAMLEYTPSFGLWQKFVRSVVSPALERVGMQESRETSDHLNSLIRGRLVSLACAHGCQLCLGNLSSYFNSWLAGEYIHPDIRFSVYRYGVQRSQDVDVWQQVWQRYMSETVPQEKGRLLSALAMTPRVWQLTKLIQYAQDPSKVGSQDFFRVLLYIARNPVGRHLVWKWVQVNWDMLEKRYASEKRYLGRLVPSMVGNFNTDFELQEVVQFYDLHPSAGLSQNALQAIRDNIAWIQANEAVIADWLGDHVDSEGHWQS